jgi:hypothetical protein
MRRRGYSSCRHLDLVPLSLLSQPHSTALPSPKRYDNRYEQELQEVRSMPAPTTHEDMGSTDDVEVGDTSLLTSFSVDGEYTSNILSERRGWLLRASATLLVEWVLREPHRGFSRLVFDLLPALLSTPRAGDPSGVPWLPWGDGAETNRSASGGPGFSMWTYPR